MKRMFLVLGMALLLPSLTGCACLYELEQWKHQILGCLHHGMGCGGGCSPCQQGGYAPVNHTAVPQFQGGCSSCGYGSYQHGTSYHVPSYGISTYGFRGRPAWHGASNGCSSCGAVGAPVYQSPVVLPAQ